MQEMDETWSLFKNLDEHILEIIRETMAEHLTSEQFYLNGMILGPLLEKILPANCFGVLDSYY